MLKRILGYLLALIGVKLDTMEDPEVLLAQATQEMTAAHEKNRQLAIQALAQKNTLQKEVETETKPVSSLQLKAEMALKSGDRDLSLQLLREKQAHDSNLTTLQASLTNAVKMTDQIKTAMQAEEEAIRTKAAQAMALKTQWKQAQIENSINQAVGGMSYANNDSAFERAATAISNAQSENSARTELGADNLDQRMAALDSEQHNAAAADELAALEAKLGLSQPASVSSNTRTANLELSDAPAVSSVASS